MKINTILFAIICISVLCITYTNASSQQLLKPIKQGTKQVGIVFVQGAQIAPEAYLPLAKKIQMESALSIYIVIPAFALNTPEPLVLSSGIKNGIKAMYDAGLDKNADLLRKTNTNITLHLQCIYSVNTSFTLNHRFNW